jgi:hypothetical protein
MVATFTCQICLHRHWAKDELTVVPRVCWWCFGNIICPDDSVASNAYPVDSSSVRVPPAEVLSELSERLVTALGEQLEEGDI